MRWGPILVELQALQCYKTRPYHGCFTYVYVGTRGGGALIS